MPTTECNIDAAISNVAEVPCTTASVTKSSTSPVIIAQVPSPMAKATPSPSTAIPTTRLSHKKSAPVLAPSTGSSKAFREKIAKGPLTKHIAGHASNGREGRPPSADSNALSASPLERPLSGAASSSLSRKFQYRQGKDETLTSIATISFDAHNDALMVAHNVYHCIQGDQPSI